MSRRIAILDPFSGIAGDMLLGALVAAGLDEQWLVDLPRRMGLEGVSVDVRRVIRKHLACVKVDFRIPPQPHGRGLREIRALLESAALPGDVKNRAEQAFDLLAEAEAGVHGTEPEKIHFHEVGAVDAILDIVGSIWGLSQLGVTAVYCGPITYGEGMVVAAHGMLPIPAPATLAMLSGHPVRPGPTGSGELVTPTGAALVRTLSVGLPPDEFVPIGSGLGAGTKELADRANALRVIIAEERTSPPGTERVVQISADIDDMAAEYVAALADQLRAAGALDVTLSAVLMKKGRPGTRVETLATPADAARLEELLLQESTTIGVRSSELRRRVLTRRSIQVEVLGHAVSIKVVELPDGGTRRKPEFSDVERVAVATGSRRDDIFRLAVEAAERL